MADDDDCWFLDADHSMYGSINFERELSGAAARDDVLLHDVLGQLGGVPPTVCPLLTRTGQEWLDRNICADFESPCTRASSQEATLCPDDGASGALHSASLQGVPLDGRDGGCQGRDYCVSNLWPDPVTGCVHGGHCALRFLSDHAGPACQHPPIFPSPPLHGQAALYVRREQSSTLGQGQSKFASVLRWRRLSTEAAIGLEAAQAFQQVFAPLGKHMSTVSAAVPVLAS